MKVIICGAGQVGANIAHYLAQEANYVTVVDQSAELTRKLSDTLDVQAVVGHASSPQVLERAGAAEADIIIAVTQSDEVNMVACQVAHSLFSVPTKIARVRRQAYLEPIYADLYSRENMPIDVIISPEIEVAHAVVRRLEVPGAFDMIPLADGLVRVIGVTCTEDCPIVNTPLRQLTGLFPDLHIEILAIIRDGRPIVPDSLDQMLPGDEVYFVTERSHMRRAMAAFGHEETAARRVVVIGGGNIGLTLAEEIEADHPNMTVRIIEANDARAQSIALNLSRTTVLTGSGLDPEMLREANVHLAEMVVTVTSNDEVNVLAALLAKHAGAKRAIALLNHQTYLPLINRALPIDAAVSPRTITASTVLQHVRRGRIRAVHSIGDGFAELIEAEALETSDLVNTPVRDIQLPPGTLIGALVRDRTVIIARPNTVVKPHDRVILLARSESVRKIEKLFAVRLEFF